MKTNISKIKREVFRASLPGILEVPDPTQIYSTFQWFLLDSIAENLIRYDHHRGQFIPVLAESWTVSGDKIVFKLKANLKFNDGTKLTAEDVEASFNRTLSMKQSTHFDVWKYLDQLTISKPSEISFNFKGDKETLFIFLSSPEASIWSKADVVAKSFVPTRFSGFYGVREKSKDGLSLERNPYSLRVSQFKNSPSRVEVIGNVGRWKSIEGIRSGQLDAFIGDYIPFSRLCDPYPDIQFLNTIPLVFIYLLKMTDSAPRPFDGALINKLWSLQDANGLLTPAHSILPPGMEGGLSQAETIFSLNKGRSEGPRQIIVGAPVSYFSEDFLEKFRSLAEASGLTIKYRLLEYADFFAALENPGSAQIDYLLSGYVASDKFPFVQLKLLTSPRNIEVISPDEDVAIGRKLEKVREIQQGFLRDQLLVPLFYVPSVTVYRADLDIGNQPTTDAELQFWRINENLGPDLPR